MIRYRQLERVVLNVSDPQRSARFYQDVVGLQPCDSALLPALRLRAGSGGCDLQLASGTPGLKQLQFSLESLHALDALATSLQAAGVAWRKLPDGPGLCVTEPETGVSLSFCSSDLPRPQMDPSARGLQRLGHVVLAAQDAAAVVRFFTEVLGFKISDRIDGAITFLRCYPNPLHHSIGIAQGNNRLDHVAFMVGGIDDIGHAMWRLQRAGVPVVNGPGRHLPSGSLFLYFLDPDGLTLEFSAEMELFPEHGARAPRLLPCVPSSFDLWEGPVDPRKAAIGAIERGPN